jgi:hypothetical protein
MTSIPFRDQAFDRPIQRAPASESLIGIAYGPESNNDENLIWSRLQWLIPESVLIVMFTTAFFE